MLFSTLTHGAMPGASDEILGIAFILAACLAGWYILRSDKAAGEDRVQSTQGETDHAHPQDSP